MDPLEPRLKRVEDSLADLWRSHMQAVLSYPNESIELHKDHHQGLEERAQLRKKIDEENSAAIRRALRELAFFVVKCVLLAAVTGTGLYGIVKNQAGIGLDAPRATVEQVK